MVAHARGAGVGSTRLVAAAASAAPGWEPSSRSSNNAGFAFGFSGWLVPELESSLIQVPVVFDGGLQSVENTEEIGLPGRDR